MKKSGEEGITVADLMNYAQKSQELGKKYKVAGERHLMHLLASVAREAESELGEQGLEMVRRAVARFGEERGARIAQTVREAGEPLTTMNFFLHSDLDASGHEMTPELVDGEFHIRVFKCSLDDRLKELGLEEYGKHYCVPIDIAILKGYNPKLQLEIESQLTGGGDCCHFVYRQPREAVESEE
jgi:hypothetical protein